MESMSKRRTLLVLVLLVVAVSLLFAGGQTERTVGDEFRIIAQDPGTSFYSYATTMTGLLGETFPSDVSVEVIPRGGSVANPMTLNAGEGEIAFALSFPASRAYHGDPEMYEGREPAQNIRGITGGMHTSYSFILARRDYVERTGYTTLEEMFSGDRLPNVGMKPTGSVVLPIADTILKTVGSSLDELRSANRLLQGTVPQVGEMLQDGRVDIYFESVPLNHPGLTEVTLTNDLVYIPVPEVAVEDMLQQGFALATVPAGSYDGLDRDYDTPALSMVILAHKDAPEDLVYLFTKAIVEGRDKLGEEQPALATWDPEVGMRPEYAAVPLHPGAQRYYDEQGWR